MSASAHCSSVAQLAAHVEQQIDEWLDSIWWLAVGCSARSRPSTSSRMHQRASAAIEASLRSALRSSRRC